MQTNSVMIVLGADGLKLAQVHLDERFSQSSNFYFGVQRISSLLNIRGRIPTVHCLRITRFTNAVASATCPCNALLIILITGPTLYQSTPGFDLVFALLSEVRMVRCK
jgi:hypothetical protein